MSKFQKYDWEGLIFPITLSKIESVTKHYKIPLDSELTIERNHNYRLIGLITGIILDEKNLEYHENGKIKEEGFINGETLRAKSNENLFLINGLVIESVNLYAIKVDDKTKFSFTCEVYLENIILLNKSKLRVDIISELYLCSLPRILFSNLTYRYENFSRYKVRNNIDTPIENKYKLIRGGYSSSWDFSVVEYKNFQIIIQSVDKKYLPNYCNGIIIEYRSKNNKFPTPEFRKMFQEYISFIIGSQIQRIGISEYELGYNLLAYKAQNPWKVKIENNGNINPIPLKIGSDRMHFQKILNELFKNFIHTYQKLSLSDCLWKLWIGNDMTIGVNIPIIASGLETLIESYLKENKILKKYTKRQKKEYRKLISDEFDSLSKKLSQYDFAPFVLNKLRNPYHFGIGEKMKLFFEIISMEFEKNSLESEAIQARNLLIHGTIELNNEEKQRKIKKLSDAYITLVNRVILKLLKYDWYYIDYSKEGIRYLKMSESL